MKTMGFLAGQIQAVMCNGCKIDSNMENNIHGYNPDWESDELQKLTINTIHGKIILKENINSNILITGENNSELIKMADNFLFYLIELFGNFSF